ncbi:MAG: methyltransferase domain-containing protein [Leptospirales bacterium]
MKVKRQTDCQICAVALKMPNKAYGKCPDCGLIHFAQARSVKYESDYFNTEYINQYGRSYLDDKIQIQGKMKERLEICHHYSAQMNKGQLLEVGSAAGFFLELVKARGMSAQGWEISKKMANIANQKGLKTKAGDFFSLYQKWSKGKNEPFQSVAMFYVLEHVSQQKKMWQALSQLVENGGHLLLALPSTAGPGFFFHGKKWVKDHPLDHFVDYSPRTLKIIAKKFGFKMLVAKSEGIHPERFPLGRFRLFRNFWKMAQRAYPVSDTFFALLQKRTQNNF